tara:strand:- start:10 stop:504 length:495 start_codon:yes stop_codon:yes gene_type:complete
MPNRLYNKQVSAKGYKKGGGVDVEKAKEFRKNKKTPVRTFIKNTMEGKYMDKNRGTAEPLDLLKTKRIKKMGGGMMMERPMMKKGGPSKKPKVRKIGALGVGKAKDFPGIKEIIKMNKQGRKRFKAGGALKPVDPKTQKGLSKLPTEVRNKMGYMKKGGKVNGK